MTYKFKAATIIFFTVYARKWKVILGRIQNKMKIIHVSRCVVFVDEKKNSSKTCGYFISPYDTFNISKTCSQNVLMFFL